MAASASFLEFLKDALGAVGAISLRRMFGGAGLYCDGVFFAIVSEDILYLKTSPAGRAAFEAEGMGPFVYSTRHGKHALSSYYRIPERLMDEPDELAAWARRAVISAREAPERSMSKARKKSA